MTTTEMILGTIVLLVMTNTFGFAYSYVVLYTNVFKRFRIQEKPYKKGVLGKRLPLFLLNFVLLTAISVSGVWMFSGFFETEFPPIWIMALQIIFVFLIDDAWFYFAHRWMHVNKWALKNIHSVHHRATTPFPLEYLYVHPLEWMIGFVGLTIGFAIVLLVMPVSIWTFWIFGAIRGLHEIHIHSDLKFPGLSQIPLVSRTEEHDLHHAKLNGNYASTFRIWDQLLGTTFKEKD